MKPMRVAGYARVSSREQSENTNALSQQIERLRQAGATEIYTDVETGTSDTRVNFLTLLELVKQDEVQEVIITRIDRLTRKLKTILEIRDVFSNSSCNLRALDDSIDLSTPAGKFHLSLLGSLAEMEVDRLGERVRHGWDAMRKNRRVAIAPFGYKVINSKLEFNEEQLVSLINEKRTLTYLDVAHDTIDLFFEAKSLRGAIRLFNEKYGVRRFNKGTGRHAWYIFGWSHTGLKDWLTSPVLMGHTFYPKKRGRSLSKSKADWEIYYNTHEPLLTPEQSYEITEILESNKQRRGFGTNKRRHSTSGLVCCAICKGTCYSVAGTRGKTPGYNYYFQCRNWRQRACDQKKTIRVEKVEEAIIKALTNKGLELATKADTATTATTTTTTNNNHTEEINTLKQQLKGLEAVGSLAFNPAIEQSKREIQRQIESMEKQNNSRLSIVNSNYELLKYIFSLEDFWKKQSEEDLTKIYKALVNKVYVLEGEIVNIELKI